MLFYVAGGSHTSM